MTWTALASFAVLSVAGALFGRWLARRRAPSS
jgi:uncharacterized membrane protein YfcA